MKKVIIVSALLFITPTAYAEEVPGTRVTGDVEITCPAGSGRGIEMNVTTKEVWSYCVKFERPTQEQITQRVTQEIPQILTEQKNANALQIQSPTVVQVDPTIDLTAPRPTRLEINATTQVVTISKLTDEEIKQNAKQSAIHNARQIAQETSRLQALENLGTEYCTAWQSGTESGNECFLEPIQATVEEIDLWLEAWKKVMAIIGWDWWL